METRSGATDATRGGSRREERGATKRPRGHYVDNTALEAAIVEYNATADAATLDRIVAMLYLIANALAQTFRFHGVDWDDLVQESVIRAVSRLDRYDPGRAKAFSFCTAVQLNHMRGMWKSQCAHRRKVFRYAASKLEGKAREEVEAYLRELEPTQGRGQD